MFKPHKLKTPFICIAIGSCLVFPARSQNTTEPANSLKEVKVVNTSPLPGIGIEKNKLPYDVQSIDSQFFKESNSLNITEFMGDHLNGVNINDIQGSPYQADVTYRGLRASSILGASQGLSIYLDGVRVNEPFGDVVNWDMLPEAAFDNVTLVPGSNPIYGLNTLGGALSFSTKSGLTTQGNELGISMGSFGRHKIELTHGNKSSDGWHRFIALSAFEEDGWRDHSPGRLQNIFAKIGRSKDDINWDISLLSGNSKLVGNAPVPSYRFGEDGSGTATSNLYEADRRSVYTYLDETRNHLSLVTFNGQRLLDANTELATTVYFRQSKRTGFSGDVALHGLDVEGMVNYSDTSQNSHGASLNLTKLLDEHQLTLGTSFDASLSTYLASTQDNCSIDSTRQIVNCTGDKLNTAGVSGKTTSYGVYASDTWKVSADTHITGAARYNQTSTSNTLTQYTSGVGTFNPEEKFTYKKLNPSIGLVRQLNSEVSLFSNYGQSNRAPTVIELGCADKEKACRLPQGLQSDPYLEQVIARTIEAGMRWNTPQQYSLSVSVYQTNNKNDILFRSVNDPGNPGSLLGYFSNFEKTRYQGINVAASKVWGRWSLQTSYSYLKATYEATADLFAGDRVLHITPGMKLPGLPEHRIKIHLHWIANDKLTLGSSLQYSSSLVTQGNEDGYLSDTVKRDVSVKGFTIFNLDGNYKIHKGLDVFARITNISNARYETYGLVGQQIIDANGSSSATPEIAKYVSPGAPRTFFFGMRYKF